MTTAGPYDATFFEGQADASLQSARVVLGQVFSVLQPRRVLDVGCGTGAWMRAALDLGAPDVLGIDGDYVDRSMLLVDPAHFLPADLASQALPDVLAAQGRTQGHTQGHTHPQTPFDLVVCMEVAEHLPFARAPSLVAELAALGDAVLFSAAIPFQYGRQHVNEQWPEFWSILFRAQGFHCYDMLRAGLWAAPGVDWWYAQNALIFAREGSHAAACLPAGARAEGRGLSLVHPGNLLTNLLGLPRRHRLHAAAEEMQDLRTIVEANLRKDTALPPLAAPARSEAAGPDEAAVFPATRMETWQPEQEVAALSRKLAETGDFLKAANEAVHSEHAVRTEVEAALARSDAALARSDAARQQVRDALDHADAELVRLRDATTRMQANGAARLLAETRLRDWQAEETERQRSAAAELEAEREAMEVDLTAKREALAVEAAALQWRAAELDHRGLLLDVREESTERVRRSRTWRAARRALRLAGRVPQHEPDPPPPPALVKPLPGPVPAPPEEPEAETRPAMQPIKFYDKMLGEVSWWVIAAAVARLKRLEVFDVQDYLRRNPDVAAYGMDPFAHFIQSGALEGRGRVNPEDLARLMGSLLMFDNAVRTLPAEPEAEPDLPALIADVGSIGIFVNTEGNVFMNDLAEDMATDLRSAGVTVDVLDENADIDTRPTTCLYIAPHEFFTLGRGPAWIRDDVLTQGFCFGTEQMQTKWFNIALPFMLMSRGMFDICAQTAEVFSRLDMAALHVLPGARLRPHTMSEKDRRHPLFGVLPRAAQTDIEPATPFKARPIDVSFFGTSSPRRDQFFARNAAFFAEYETFNYSRRPGRGPIKSEGEDGTLTRLAGHVAGHSKISLNIHQEELGYFEWHRMVRLGMGAGSLVVSDPCLPHPSFIAGEHYLQESLRHMPNLLEWLLTTEDGAREAERVRANVDTLITKTYDTRRTVTQTMRFLAHHRSRERG